MGRILINTDLLQERAKHFLKHGYYSDAPEGTRDYHEFWQEELRRIQHGFSVGGLYITGYHYFYLNYCQILRVEDQAEISGRRGVGKIQSFPAFWDGDYNYFWAVEIARRGIDPELYKKLGLEIQIRPEDLAGGRHLVVLKARGKGYSYKAGSMLATLFNTGRKMKAYAMAFEKEYLTKDGVLNKAWDNISFMDNHTAFRQPRLKDQEMHKQSGYKRNIGGTDVARGTLNEIIGVTLKDDPDKARGKRGELIFFEEAGKFPGLLKAWTVSRPSVEQGAYTAGIQIAYGTGGTEDANYDGLEELFYNPEAHNVIAMNNIWDDGAQGTLCSFFVPAYQNWEGFIGPNGNSDNEGAKAYHDEQRELKREKSQDVHGLEQYICENPFTPREATLQTTANLLPTIAIQEQLNSVLTHRRYGAGTPGTLYRDITGNVKLKVTQDAKPIYEYPLKRGQDTTGCIVVYEAPVKGDGGKVPHGLYCIGHDPYAHDNSVGGSLGAAFVLKRASNLSSSLNEGIVASFVGRPLSQDEYNEQLLLLAEYFGCKIGFENDRGDVIGYAKRFRKLHLLEEEFEMLDKKELQSRRVRRPYGMHMTEGRKRQGEIYIRDWLNQTVTHFDNGESKSMVQTILDPGLLRELLKFNHKGNFDRVMALMVSMYYLKELHNAEVTPREEPKHHEFFDRAMFS